MAVNLKNLTHIAYHRFLFRVNDYFLCQNGLADRAINYYIQCQDNVEGKLEPFYTLLVNLNHDKNKIWEAIQPGTKSEIASFVKNQSYEHRVQTNLSKTELLKFIKLFNQFAKHKNIRRAEKERLIAYHKHQILAISWIRQNNTFICINFYRLTRERATNLHSFHLKHALPAHYSQSHFGRAHRALHWLDIVTFKEAGVACYDFCGWYHGHEDKALLNINRFKEQFTGHKVKEFSGVIYKNKFLLFLKRLK